MKKHIVSLALVGALLAGGTAVGAEKAEASTFKYSLKDLPTLELVKPKPSYKKIVLQPTPKRIGIPRPAPIIRPIYK